MEVDIIMLWEIIEIICFDFCEVLMGGLFILCVYEGIWYLLIYIYEVCLMLL